MTTRLLAGAVLVAVALAASACGSGHSTGRSTGEHRKLGFPSFDSAHHYSVADVERAFAAHGISFTVARPRMPDSLSAAVRLHILRKLPRNLVSLRADGMPHAVFAAVVTSSRPIRIPFVNGVRGGERFITTRRRNLIVYFDSGHRAAVRAALAQLTEAPQVG